jgi:predicted protein tyrosine phosphatase
LTHLPNLLFICSKNQWRSPTAELLFKDNAQHTARSAGTSNKACVKVNQKLIDWADVIFAMERKHRDILKQNFPSSLLSKQLIILDIEDDYRYNDPELIEIFKTCLADYL